MIEYIMGNLGADYHSTDIRRNMNPGRAERGRTGQNGAELQNKAQAEKDPEFIQGHMEDSETGSSYDVSQYGSHRPSSRAMVYQSDGQALKLINLKLMTTSPQTCPPHRRNKRRSS